MNLRHLSALAILVVSVAVAAEAEAGPTVSNGRVALTGRVAVEGTGFVELSGEVNVVTRVMPVDGGHLVTVYAALPADASATGPGETRFVALGSSRHADVHRISNGELIPCIMPGFTLLQLPAGGDAAGDGSVRPTDFDITLRLQFSESGQLIAGDAVAGAFGSGS
jgi:hypothetical protein